MLTRGFLANGGILKLSRIKVNLKRVFLCYFAHYKEVILFKRQKDQLSDDRKRLRFLEFEKNWLA
ncbi:TPA: hypothetical protein ACIBE0_003875, partial [Salmonella enterica subsp. enterica serovar Muenchen]